VVTDLLPGIVKAALDALPIPRRMHWARATPSLCGRFTGCSCLYGKDVVPVTLLDTVSGDLTRGTGFTRRNLSALLAPASYAGALSKRGYVLPDFAGRREVIREGVTKAAAELGGRALIGDALLERGHGARGVAVPIAGGSRSVSSPCQREVLISTLQEHQRYFPWRIVRGGCCRFITVRQHRKSGSLQGP